MPSIWKIEKNPQKYLEKRKKMVYSLEQRHLDPLARHQLPVGGLFFYSFKIQETRKNDDIRVKIENRSEPYELYGERDSEI